MKFNHTQGNFIVEIDDKWPFDIKTKNIDTGEIVFKRGMPCYSTKDKNAQEAIECINFNINDRQACSSLNKKAIADEKIRAAAPEMFEELIEAYKIINSLDEQNIFGYDWLVKDLMDVIEKATDKPIEEFL